MNSKGLTSMYSLSRIAKAGIVSHSLGKKKSLNKTQLGHKYRSYWVLSGKNCVWNCYECYIMAAGIYQRYCFSFGSMKLDASLPLNPEGKILLN